VQPWFGTSTFVKQYSRSKAAVCLIRQARLEACGNLRGAGRRSLFYYCVSDGLEKESILSDEDGMKQYLGILLVIIVWLVVSRWVLPRFGIVP
jgi:hypothetical protein